MQQTKFFVILDHFLPFYKSKNQNFEKMKKHLQTLSFYTCVNMMYGPGDMKHDEQNFLSFWTIFCPFTPIKTRIIKILKKNLKMHGDIIILQKCTKNHDHMPHYSWDTMCDWCNYFLFWAIFCPFTSLATQKIKILKKRKINLGDIIILHMCT